MKHVELQVPKVWIQKVSKRDRRKLMKHVELQVPKVYTLIQKMGPKYQKYTFAPLPTP